MKAILILAAALGLAAQQPTVRCIDGKGCESDGKPIVPAVDPTAAAAFWRAQAELLAIKPDFEAKDAAVKAALAKLTAACGKDHQLADNNGLVCTPKPKEEPKK